MTATVPKGYDIPLRRRKGSSPTVGALMLVDANLLL